ncbi:MAG TPA: 3-methyl-2-oxobutanoate hydroxymethyltransferase [Terrisporobacter glycolicus]|uniref:3-methyl-2-oxobutanoate hydroxymethyltransferase n=1 Tax=Terrisporobacter hibernicus TaxID=2813371 RepID=UPI000E9F8DE6|nr:3-methyl-2-oxobutanoate hydroxymethyltransferase [Terrisporobacter hibernicus]HBI93283.1 3-methyl-2-oxobutanoate hydroxymethyltransferase [Terrisporobacter hibernicus]
MKKKVSVLDLKQMKQEGKKFTMVTAYDYTSASIVNASDVELILVGDSLGMVMMGYDSTTGVTMEEMIHHIKPVVKGAPNTFIVGDMPFGSYNVTIEKAIENANRIMKETGCDCVKLEGGVEFANTIAAIVRAGIPVMAHLGLTPQTTAQLGGFKFQGKDLKTANKLIEDITAVSKAGAFAAVVECVPSQVAKVMSESVDIPIIGIGAGPDVEAQVLVTQDMMGMYDKFTPKFVKKYSNIRDIMIKVYNEFSSEVSSGSFPSSEYSFNIKIEGLE